MLNGGIVAVEAEQAEPKTPKSPWVDDLELEEDPIKKAEILKDKLSSISGEDDLSPSVEVN